TAFDTPANGRSRRDGDEAPRDLHAIDFVPELARMQVRVLQDVCRLGHYAGVDATATAVRGDLLLGARAEESFDGRFPPRAQFGVERGAIVGQPVHSLQRILH